MSKAKKVKTNVRALIEQYQQNCDRIAEIADVCEKENRSRTDGEEAEYKQLTSQNQVIEMRIRAASTEYSQANPNARAEAEELLRSTIKAGKKAQIILVRDAMVVSDMSDTGTIPLNIQDILEPLTEGMLLDKVGLPFMTGLAGDYVWPMYEMVEATVLDEAASLSDTKIPFSKMMATPARCGIKVPVSNQSLNQTDGLLEQVVRKIMPEAIRRLLNKILLGRTAVNNAAATAGLVGPFVNAKKVNLSAVPSFHQLNLMKADILETGIDGEYMCYTMTKSMQAILEGTPINSNGVYIPMIQGGKLCGLPVYTSNEMRDVAVSYKKYTSGSWTDYTLQDSDTVAHEVKGTTEAGALAKIASPKNNAIAKVSVITEYIGLGDWRYQPMGLFGNNIRFIVDPFTGAGEDIVKFILNCDYGTKTLRPEAFLLGQVAAE